jgi:hypothetical protein
LIQKAIDILKARWPEVVMVVVLQAAMMLLLEEVVSDSEKMDSNAALMPFWASFLLGMGTILCAVLWQMLYLGFLKTAAVFGSQPQQPVELLRSGRPYFWRIVFFQILIGIALMFLNMAIVAFLGYLIWQAQTDAVGSGTHDRVRRHNISGDFSDAVLFTQGDRPDFQGHFSRLCHDCAVNASSCIFRAGKPGLLCLIGSAPYHFFIHIVDTDIDCGTLDTAAV